MILRTLFAVVICSAIFLMCSCDKNSSAVNKKYAEVIAIAKIGQKFGEVEAALKARGFAVSIPSQVSTIETKYMISVVTLSKTPFRATLQETTGWNISVPRSNVVIEINDEGLITAIK